MLVGLSVGAAFFEGVGLSMIVPLLAILGQGEAPLIGGPFGYLGRLVALEASEVVLLAAGFFVCGLMAGYLNDVLAARLGMRIVHRVRLRLFHELLRRPVSLVENEPRGLVVNTLASETWRVSEALLVVMNVVVQTITVAVFAVLLWALSPFYSLVLAAAITAVGATVYQATRSVRRLGKAALRASEGFTVYLWDVLGGLRTIRGCGLEDWECARFAGRSDGVRDAFTRLAVHSALVRPLSRIFGALIVAGLVLIALARGNDLAVLGGFLAIAYRAQPRVTGILQAEVQLRGLEASLAAVELALAQSAVSAPCCRFRFDQVRKAITFECVTARYPGAREPALHEICCSIAPGRVTALAGPSGAGKSTMAALLLRFLDPESGRILVDGVPLTALNPREWHRRIAFVEQDSYLFNTSIRENIAYGLAADLQHIRRVARLAQADDFIESLESGYDTVLQDHGRGLSQGQRQRIALARALLREPSVLVLDEATNALDPLTEQTVRAMLHPTPTDRVVIVIAHRPETIAAADEVVVLDRGQIVEAGIPADLLAGAGVFARHFGAQSTPLRVVT